MVKKIREIEKQIDCLFQAGKTVEVTEKYFDLANLQVSMDLFDEAEGNFLRVLELNPEHIAAMNNRGLCLIDMQKQAEAMTCFRKIIALRSEEPVAFYNLGNCLMNLGRPLEAIDNYRQALSLKKDYPDAWHNLGVVYKEQGDYQQAEEAFKAELRLAPDHADGWFFLGMIYHLNNFIKEAVASYREALKISDHPVAAYNLGICMHDSGDYLSAIELFKKVIAWQPDNAAAWNNLGRSLDDSCQVEEAAMAYEQAVVVKPDFCDAIANLANIWRDKGQRDKAIAAYEKALSYDSGHAQSMYNLGCCYQDVNELGVAEDWYRRSIAVNSGLVEAHWNLSHVLLLDGRYDEGFKEYQWRWRRPATPMPNLAIPEWGGEQNLDITLLVHTEQGFGDTIQFVRYLPLLKGRVGRVLFVCEDALIPLLIHGDIGADAVIPKNSMVEVARHCDFHIGLLALPSFFTDDNPETIPPPIKFVPSVKLVDQYAAIFENSVGKMRIGLVWKGSKGHKNDKKRSCNLKDLMPVLNYPGAEFFSLQKEADSDLDSTKIIDLSSYLVDFHHTSAIIHHLDLIISVDTSVAHLAGTMGKSVWLMLPFVPDWRWLLNRENTPWYSSMRIFRQDENRQWSKVVTSIKDELP